MSSRSQKALMIAVGSILFIVAAIFVILYLTGQVDDFLGVTGDTSEISSVTESLPQSKPESSASVPQSTPESSASVPQSTPESASSVQQSTQESTSSVPQSTPESTASVPQSAPESSESALQSTPESVPTVQTTYKFRNKNLLTQHYEKHGREMGFASAADYEKAASDVVNNPAALHKIEKEDGDDVYYVESTNEFVVVSTDGYIRTYFLPDRGIDYYNKQ